MRRRKLLVMLAAVVVMVASAGALMLLPGPDVNAQRNYDRISAGMSVVEVEVILGPPGDYRTAPTDHYEYGWGHIDQIAGEASQVPDGGKAIVWETDTARLEVLVDASSQVSNKGILLSTPKECGLLDGLLWRAKRQWRTWFP